MILELIAATRALDRLGNSSWVEETRLETILRNETPDPRITDAVKNAIATCIYNRRAYGAAREQIICAMDDCLLGKPR